jgi:3-oxoacyl-[acyl-carrier-protein] synthase II
LCNINVAATVPVGKHEWNAEYSTEVAFGKSKQSSKFIEYAQVAAELSLRSAGINKIADVVEPTLAGVAIGNGGIGSISDVNEANASLTQSFKKLTPYFVPKVLVNMAAGQVSIKHGLKGPVHSVATACAAGAHSIGDAYNFIRLGYADLMLAGGTDASVDALSIAGFARMKALGRIEGSADTEEGAAATGTDKDAPSKEDGSDSELKLLQQTSRPFHPQRNGFVIGEGAGVLVLEELASAQRRGARIFAEVCGYGLSGDAFNATSPPEDGNGAARSMRMALRDAGIAPGQVGYVNAHATSTPAGDAAEVAAIREVFGEGSAGSAASSAAAPTLFVSSTKGATGHLLGAAGAVEAIFTVWALHTGHLPPTLNLDHVDSALQGGGVFAHVPLRSVCYADVAGRELRYAVKNSFGFGGTNASLVLGKYVP